MIQIGNTPVILLDPRGMVEPAVERHHSVELMRAFNKSASVMIPRGANLLFPNYPDLPAPRINQLVIPTGATRWSYGLFLVNTAQKDAILAEASANSRKVKVQFCTANNWQLQSSAPSFQPVLQLTMSPLPPRPITPTNVAESDDLKNLWLLPMVDQRYWWQFLNVDQIESQAFSDVAAVVDYLNEKLNGTATLNLTCANPKHDRVPDIATDNNYENLAVVIETLAWHLGCQLVPDIARKDVRNNDLDTQFRLMSVDDSSAIYANNMAGKVGVASCTRASDGTVTSPNSGYEFVGSPAVEGGGLLNTQNSPFLPERIVIPAKDIAATRKASEVGITLPVMTGTTGVLRLKWKDTTTVPDALRDQAVKDYYNRFLKCYDYTFSGVQRWQPTAWDDCLIVSQVRQTSGYFVQTRVRSWLQNLMPETMVAATKTTTTTTPSTGSSACGNCLSCLDVTDENSHADCANLAGRSPNSWFLQKDMSDCCNNVYDSNIELIHTSGCTWESKEYECKERFIDESYITPGTPNTEQLIYVKWILTVGATWTELEQRFYKKT